jgi:hypothetical protein
MRISFHFYLLAVWRPLNTTTLFVWPRTQLQECLQTVYPIVLITAFPIHHVPATPLWIRRNWVAPLVLLSWKAEGRKCVHLGCSLVCVIISAVRYPFVSMVTCRLNFFFLSFSGWGETESTLYVGHCFPIVPARMIDDDDYGAVGEMRIGRGNRSTQRKPAPVLICPPQIPHDLTWDRTRAAAVGSQRLTAWAMARP